MDFGGAVESVHTFVSRVLADEITETVHTGPDPAVDNFHFAIEMGLKAGLLDLEREYILRYLESGARMPFSMNDIRKTNCYYFSGDKMDLPPDRFVADMVNPVIHRWNCAYADIDR